MRDPDNFTPRRARRRHARLLLETVDENPLSSVANLFDVAMMFAVALLIATFAVSRAHEWLTSDDITIVKNADGPDMEIIRKKGNKLERLRRGDSTADGMGERLGICYRLESGEVVYVPESP